MDDVARKKFKTYPKLVQGAFQEIRSLILNVAKDESLGHVEEELKWGQLSYRVNSGSTIRVDWSAETPEQGRIFFHCQTTLIETFRELYPVELNFEGNRAIVFSLNQALPIDELTVCVSLALRYHRIKHLPMLGM